jgi:hypothetical protein
MSGGGLIQSSSTDGTVNAHEYVGGLVGSIGLDGSSDSSSIVSSFSNVAVTSPYNYVGGLVGAIYSGTSINSSYATGVVSTAGYPGGIRGNLFGINSGGTVSSDSFGTGGAYLIQNQTVNILSNGSIQPINGPSVSSSIGYYLRNATLINNNLDEVIFSQNLTLGSAEIFQLNSGSVLKLLGTLSGPGSLLVTGSGALKLSNSVTTGGSQTYSTPVTLSNNVALTTNNQYITFNSTVDANEYGVQSLTTSTGTGITFFNGAVGYLQRLSSINVNGPATMVGVMQTTGNQTYAGNVILNNDLSSLSTGYGNGSTINLTGTSATLNAASNPITYQVLKDLTGLQNVGSSSQNLSGNWMIGTNIDASASVSMNSSAGFNPIGNVSTPFTGTMINPLNHTISNLTINRPNSSDIGLFGRVGAGSHINFMKLTNANVVGDTNVGGLVGFVDGGQAVATIVGGSVTGTVTGNLNVGGLAGHVNNFSISGNE